MKVTLPRTLVNALLHHAQEVGDGVAVGIITCQNSKVMKSYPIAANRSPKRIAELMAHIRDQGEEVCAIYHSHDSDAYNEINNIVATDKVLNLAVSVDTKGVLEIRAYQDNGTLHEAELTISQ